VKTFIKKKNVHKGEKRREGSEINTYMSGSFVWDRV